MKLSEIMLIDDCAIDNYISSTILKRNNAAEAITPVLSASTALVYLKNLASNSEPFPKIIFLDMIMPDLDGCSFIEKYAEFPESSRETCSLYILSASRKPEDMEKAKKSSDVKEYLFKPLTDIKVKKILEREITLQNDLHKSTPTI